MLIVGGFILVQLLVQKTRWEPLVISKVNTVLQIVLAAATLARLGLGLDDHGLGRLLVLAVAASTVLSGAAYLVRWARSTAGTEVGR